MKLTMRYGIPASRLAVLAIVMWLAMAGTAFADSVRVTRDKSTIWRADAPSVALTVVPVGTILEVVSRQGVWLRVRMPRSVGDPNVMGLILASAVTPVTGSLPPSPATPGQPGAKPPAPRPARQPLLIRGFGQVGYMQFTATKSFNAIFEKDATVIPGGGVQAIWPSGVLASGEVEWYELTGQRAFVDNGEVFRLGIEEKVRVIPISATFGYQFLRRSVARPYAGAGFNFHLFRETSEFAGTGEDVDEHFTGFHLVGGVDLLSRQRVSAAIEAQYTSVRDAIGKAGVSQIFNEKDLGGFTVRMKVLFH